MALFIGFAIKIPAFPFHTWLPDAHVEAPTAISVILAGVLLKMGTYGILRINFPMLPAATADLGLLVSRRARRLEHYLRRALRHGAKGSQKARRLFERQPHGLRHARHGELYDPGDQWRGVADVQSRHDHRHALPFGRRDLRPGTSPRHRRLRRLGRHHARLHGSDRSGLFCVHGFAGAFRIHLGSFGLARHLAKISGTDDPRRQRRILTAGYLLWTIQRVYLGPPNEKYLKMPDINGREMFTLVPLGAIVIIVGVYPSVVLDLLRASLDQINQDRYSASSSSTMDLKNVASLSFFYPEFILSSDDTAADRSRSDSEPAPRSCDDRLGRLCGIVDRDSGPLQRSARLLVSPHDDSGQLQSVL